MLISRKWPVKHHRQRQRKTAIR